MKENKYSDIHYIPTANNGQVLLRAGRKILGNGFELWEVSVTVPEEFAKTLLIWKKNYDIASNVKSYDF